MKPHLNSLDPDFKVYLHQVAHNHIYQSPPPLSSTSIPRSLTLLSPKKMSAATLFIPLSEKSIRDSWIGDWSDKDMTREYKYIFFKVENEVENTNTRALFWNELYLGEFDHVNRVFALLPLFGFLITTNRIQASVSNAWMWICFYLLLT